MIVKTYEAEKIKNLEYNFFLLYGQNDGFKNQIIQNILSEGFKDNIIRFDESEIISKSEIFYSEINNKSLFNDKKLIIISRASEKLNKFLEDFLDTKLEGTRIIINAGLLEKKSKLRSNFEKKKNLICIPFYSDDNSTLSKIAYFFFKEKKISISQENINLLIERCRGSRENLTNELSKIENYAKNKKIISNEDIIVLTNLAENYSYFELCDQCLAKNLKKILHIINENNYGNEDCIGITRVLMTKTKRLIRLKEQSLNQTNIDGVISSFRPPIFWKEKDIVKTQMLNWNLDNIKNLLFELNDLELNLKKNNENAVNILYDFIINKSKTNNLILKH